MTGPYDRPDFPYANQPAEEEQPPTPAITDEVRPPHSSKLRIGDRVRCTKPDDPFIDHGVEGIVVNTAPPRPYSPGRARILWETDQLCMMDDTDFEVLPSPHTKPQQPTVMPPFPGRAA